MDISLALSAQIGITTALVVMIVTNLVGNSLVVLTVVKICSMRTPFNYLLVNLAIADMTVGVSIAPRYVFSHACTHLAGNTGTYLCKLLTGEVFTWLGTLCSVYTLVAISIERYYAVIKQVGYKGRFTMKRIKLTVAGCWLIAVLYCLPLFAFSYFNEKSKFCNFAWPFKQFLKFHSTMCLLLYGIIPIGTMVYLYSRVTYKLWFKTKGQGAQHGILASRKRITKMVLSVSIIFCITWVPNLVTYAVSAYSETPLYHASHIVSIVLATFNSSINPIVYSLQSRMFRKNIWRVMTCSASQNKVTIAPHGTDSRSEKAGTSITEANQHDMTDNSISTRL